MNVMGVFRYGMYWEGGVPKWAAESPYPPQADCAVALSWERSIEEAKALMLGAYPAGFERMEGYFIDGAGWFWGIKPRRVVCGARCRDGHACRRKSVAGQLRCRNHGGLSTGPTTERGRESIAESNRRRGVERQNRKRLIQMCQFFWLLEAMGPDALIRQLDRKRKRSEKARELALRRWNPPVIEEVPDRTVQIPPASPPPFMRETWFYKYLNLKHIQAAHLLAEHPGNDSRIAAAVGISRTTLWRWKHWRPFVAYECDFYRRVDYLHRYGVLPD